MARYRPRSRRAGQQALTDVNVKFRNTLLASPEHFWYFSNSITLLCDSIKRSGSGRPGCVGDFHLTGASVVNGARRWTAIHRACTADIEKVGRDGCSCASSHGKLPAQIR
ncbi:hypothetical protein E1287_16045 [Actinomadura sp. KC06]|nr:hypothetical protein E1287_16045 [Actinomadura sp. KC06]